MNEEIQSSKQPAGRRSVIDFVGQTDGVALGSNVFLSFSFSSSAVPEAPDLEVLAWDEVNGTTPAAPPPEKYQAHLAEVPLSQ